MSSWYIPFSLRACIAFEASFRHSSFKKAAEELKLTQAAVSYQVRKIEDVLGCNLFHRNPRSLTPTPDGKAFVIHVQRALTILDHGCETIMRKRSPVKKVVISAAQSIAAKWLLPRLSALQAALQRHYIELDATDECANLKNGSVDIAIRYLKTDMLETDDELQMVPLFKDERIYPICSPDIGRLFQDGPHEKVFSRVPLLHHRKQDIGWKHWFSRHGISGVNSEKGQVFSHYSTLIDAAINGQGIALGRSPLMDDDLISGRLVKAMPGDLLSDYGYFIVFLANRKDDKEIGTIINGLRVESEKLTCFH